LEKKARELGLSATKLALSSGEEYELLFTCPASEEEKLLAYNQRHRKDPFAVLGRTVKSPKKVLLKKKDGRAEEIKATGYKHF
jgi:thiamine monophosphate kinase